MPKFSHRFIETLDGFIAFGLDRATDQEAVNAYLQMFSDDDCMAAILPRMSDEELGHVFDLVSRLLRRHFDEDEYHALFLKEPHAH
ncbi:putative cytoplasmic protein [Desulfarculus baarsii DSM 2075]|uniref:Cytoplasmic protein n=1 Tax=Desulfarculus baarsii (strain ATCC 33931 / DSM 2075 / LMG 7858 / VKM B-1802 / 2st14) TaxID=644282 RepID=E1QLN1_DESB2|nr:hypothetical protein [Desulfarculus baarsii]ADK86466.1 putative cytoplasmic protein [Desulfarculus baarsii DSM 2075]